MAEQQAGITALITSYARAYHATHDSPVIFDDSLADRYFTPEEHIQFDQNLANMLPMLNPELAATQPDQASALAFIMQTMHCPITLSRSRYTEECLEAAVRMDPSAQQYVLLGAGMDTFAFRRPDLLAQLNVYEVDHPVTQALKRQRIALAGWEIPAQLHLVPVDFTRQSISTALQESSYDPQKRTFFSWLGVSFYLTREVFFSTLQSIARIAPRGSSIVFDYMDPAAFSSEASPRMRRMYWIAQQVGEPMKASFDPAALADELAALGLDLQVNLSPAEIEARYFQGRNDLLHAFEHLHLAHAVVV
jgi:methyltransferase (TIGR00027 family)